MLASMACFALSDTLLKLATTALPTGQIMAVRGLFASTLALAFVLGMGEWRSLPRLADRIVILRGALEAATALTFIIALAKLPLANITAIVVSSPLMIAFALAATGAERVGWRRAAAIMVGFIGVLLIVRPGVEGFSGYTVLAVVCAILITARDLATRRIAAGTPSSVITLSTTLTVMVLGFGLGSSESWVPFWTRETALLAVAAIFVTAGNFGIIVAFRNTDASVVAPFRYAVVVLAMGLGLVVFGEFPDLLAIGGMGLIIGSGLYAIYRERVRGREATAHADAAQRPAA